MISFPFLRVWQRIKQRLPYNLWLLLRLTAGLTLLIFSISVMQSVSQTVNEGRYNNSRFKRLALLSRQGEFLKELPLASTDIMHLTQQYPQAQFSQLIVGDLAIIAPPDLLRFDRFILAQKDMLPELGLTSMPGVESLSLLQNAVLIYRGEDLLTGFLQDALVNETVFALQPSPLAQNALGLRASDEVEYVGPLWLFLVPGPLPEQVPLHAPLSYALLPETNERDNVKIAADIQGSMAALHQDMRALVLNADEKIALSAQKANGLSQQLFFLTIIILTVVVIGIFGNYLILCDRRRQEFAVLNAIGVSKQVLVMELWIENTGLFLLSWMLSFLPGKLLINQTNFAGIAVHFTGMSLLAPLLGSMALSTLITMLGVRTVLVRTAARTLREG